MRTWSGRQFTADEVIKHILNGTAKFSTYDGRNYAAVDVVGGSAWKPGQPVLGCIPYLRSIADKDAPNNLDNLPEF